MTIPTPGELCGPCEGPCGHEPCRAMRRTAGASCVVCGKPIGYGQPYYKFPKEFKFSAASTRKDKCFFRYVHVACHQGKAVKKKNKRIPRHGGDG